MEQQKMKRGRQGEDERQKEWYENENNVNGKRRDVRGMKLMKEVEKEKKEKQKAGCSSDAWESQLALGVFDFPWLKDGVTCKSEDYFLDFEDNFSSLLQQEDASSKASTVDLSRAYGLFETPEDKLEDIAWQPFESDMVEHEAEDVDCIWSSLLKHPL
ncbi:hypothetical protein PHAVU_003G089000 [Phaseolus vulgaris]|uniref:Uncharacterized protein n=1 Tax=Phaseolus vulgaris TaxID=3885 RepID=V7C7B0_PHAVU|nr:hypothetical protein PHAVU_003G089000g [Phaseolus vulgaris]ESW26072.1 hypothetical protein PHAVU_003G089000g [Phaseolus vulgaris]